MADHEVEVEVQPEEAASVRRDGGVVIGTGRPLPLNSKKLTGVLLKQLARGLEIPTSSSGDDLRTLIEGKLGEMGHDPRNTQAVLQEAETGINISLQDAEGVFLTVKPIVVELGGLDDPPSESADEDDVGELRAALREAKEQQTARELEVARLQEQLEKEKERYRKLWSLNCAQLTEFDNAVSAKDEEIDRLKVRLRSVSVEEPTPGAPSLSPVVSEEETEGNVRTYRRGRAPPVEMFSGEDSENTIDDWLPALMRAAEWNGWTKTELLLQLAGHLKGRARQEWSLLPESEKSDFEKGVHALRARLDPGSKALAAQDFRHAAQYEHEKVSDFIRRIEKTFRRAYGHDSMLAETRDALLYAQLQEGLKYDLMKAPAVSGALSYQALCVAAKSEERRLAELQKRKQYQSPSSRDTKRVPVQSTGASQPRQAQRQTRSSGASYSRQGQTNSNSSNSGPRRCWNCDETGHMAHNCPKPKKESTGSRSSNRPVSTKMVSSAGTEISQEILDDPLQYLMSDSDDSTDVRQVRIQDQGSRPQKVRVTVGGVPMLGVIDTAADISIMGGNVFKKVATVAKLRKRDFKPTDKTPYNFDGKPFRLDGKLVLDISFGDRTMKTDVYVKMDATEQVLLSEGVCRQLGIVTYHPDVEAPPPSTPETGAVVSVPAVKVQLVQSVKLPPRPDQSIIVDVRWERDLVKGPLILEAIPSIKLNHNIHVADTFVSDADAENGTAKVVLTNCLGFTQCLERGEEIGRVLPIDLVEPGDTSPGTVSKVTTGEQTTIGIDYDVKQRKEKLRDLLKSELDASPEGKQLGALLEDYHEVFSVSKEDRGETDLIELNINTGDATPRKYPVRRVPFAVRDEIARNLREMQAANVIQPSTSPWASPVVLVRKKDGTLRFCVDYRGLNSVTKLDQFPLPRIDDLLDQLGKSHYFTTLDLASGYWQIRVDKPSREKTAFITHQGLFEFCVMPFGLTNAPAVFQRLMQRVLRDLKTDEEKDFAEVYIDDVLIFSETLEAHLEHIRLVLERLKEAGLKLKPSKCHFLRECVEYLGHLITPNGLKPNPKQVKAVIEFPVPESVTSVRQFLGLTSYYRRFIARFAKIAAPLHALTRKNVAFEWSAECQEAFEALKAAITQSPVLAYPNFEVDFVLETDASVKGLGAVLSQPQSDGVQHPVAFASRSLSPAERNYGVTELETLAVVWAMQHFRAYLYGHRVTVITDHSAVKTVLGAPCSSGKHARWWLKVFGSGAKDVQIVYRPGRDNDRADALSRNPAPTQKGHHLELEAHVAQVSADAKEISSLLQEGPDLSDIPSDFHLEQKKDPELKALLASLDRGELPSDRKEAHRITVQALQFTVIDGLLYFVDPKAGSRKRVVVPAHLRESILKESHGGVYAGHFSGGKLYNTICRSWWWPTMYRDVMEYCKNCPDCAVVSGTGRKYVPPLHPIPVQRPFQIFGVDIMELPVTERGNRYVIVFQDFLTKWPLVFPAPDQKAIRIARLVAEEIVPMFGVPESLLSDRGTNLLANVMMDVCSLMGITKLNTTAYHPQCNGMIERMNRTLKAMLRKHAVKFGPQWDKFLPGVLWAYRNTPHETTKEKPSFLMFGLDLRSPTEATLLPATQLQPSDVSDYREELILSLSSARELAATTIRQEQKRAKETYDRKSKVKEPTYKLGDWVLVRFPQEESGKKRKLSKPWHGPYRVVQKSDPDVTVVPVHFPESGTIQVHQSRVCPCPPKWPAGFYWYGGNKLSHGRMLKWLEDLLPTATEPTPPEEECVLTEDVISPIGEANEAEPICDLGEEEPVSSQDDADMPVPSRIMPPSGRYNLRHAVKPPERLCELFGTNNP